MDGNLGDPLAGSSWSAPSTVAGFARSSANEVLLGFARGERRAGSRRLLDLGCGAGRNAIPLARDNRRAPGVPMSGGPPVIYEAAFRRAA